MSPKTISQQPKKSRLIIVDIMVGLAMIFVVLGHQSFPFSPYWYAQGLHEWIYRFHMEVFVFLSAFLIRYSYKGGNYLQYVGRKFKKFFIPFLLVGWVVGLVAAWGRGVEGSDVWGHLWSVTQGLLLYPMASDASFLWYIYLLFGYYLITPLVVRLPSWLKMTLCLLSMGLPLLGAGHFLGGYMFARYTFFYFLGVLCAEGWEQLRDVKTWVWTLLSLPFLLWSVKYLMHETTFLEVGPAGYDILSGCIALPFFYCIARLIGHVGWLSAPLCRISKDCFWIYLLQMFIAWGCAYALRYSGLMEVFPFWLFLIVSSALCILVPIGCAWCGQKVGAISLKKGKSRKARSKKK